MNAISPIATAADVSKGWQVSTAGRSLDVLSKQWIARPRDERFLTLMSVNPYLHAT